MGCFTCNVHQGCGGCFAVHVTYTKVVCVCVWGGWWWMGCFTCNVHQGCWGCVAVHVIHTKAAGDALLYI